MKRKTNRFVYIIQAADGTYYTGMTKDVAKRLALHESGKGAKYLRGRAPLSMVYCEKCADVRTAMIRELQIKKYSKRQKQNLIDAPPAKKRKSR